VLTGGRPDPRQLDLLRELATEAAARAIGALARVIRRPITSGRSTVRIAPAAEARHVLGNATMPAATAIIDLLGALAGRLLMVIPEDDAQRLCAIVFPGPPAGARMFDAIAQSALKELAVVAGAEYAQALAARLNEVVAPSIPRLVLGPVGDVLVTPHLYPYRSARDERMLCIETRFRFDDLSMELHGQLVLVPAPGAVTRLTTILAIP
jgi:chemotaxis protein CheY-P-specific phosphatase CheC